MIKISNNYTVCQGKSECIAHIIKRQKSNIKPKIAQNINSEIEKIETAYSSLIDKTQYIYEQMPVLWNDKSQEIFGAFLMLFKDRTFIDTPIKLINENNYTCEYAIYKTVKDLMDTFREIDNLYIKERINDLDEIGYYLINEINNFPLDCSIKNNNPCVLVTNKIGCIDLALINKNSIKGIITQSNMTQTHSLLIAQTENIPIIVGVKNILNIAKENNIIKINNADIEIYQ